MGVLVFKGMKVGILPGDFTISLDKSSSENPNIILSTAYNVIPVWLRIACDSHKQAKAASQNITDKWSDNTDNQKDLLIAELAPSMQVFVACGIALDGLYDTLRPYAKISNFEIETWKKKKTSRATQISEVIRRTFKLVGVDLQNLAACIDNIIKYRDLAVHPSLELKNACNRPDIPVGVDWKFSAYRFSNSDWCINNTINIIAYLYEHKSNSTELDGHINNIIEALLELKVVKRNACLESHD